MIPPLASPTEQSNPWKYFGGVEFWDNYGVYSRGDSEKWLFLMSRASADLSSALMIARNTGAVLIPNDGTKYRVAAVIKPEGWETITETWCVQGKVGWDSQEQYGEHRKLIEPFGKELIRLLGGLK